MYPEGEVLVTTPKANIETTWAENIELYTETWKQCEDFNQEHVDVLTGLDTVVNIEWWFSEQNQPVAHYNRLIRLLTTTTETRDTLISLSVDELTTRTIWQLRRMKRESRRHLKLKKALHTFRAKQCRLLRHSLHKQGLRLSTTRGWNLRQLRKECTPRDIATNASMLSQTAPTCPYLLIVDECQDYVHNSAQSSLVCQLAKQATCSLMLSATPIHAVENTHGLTRLLGGSADWDKKILYTTGFKMNARVQAKVMSVVMTTSEWKAHQQVRQRWCGRVQNAYLCKSRQLCNNATKWSAMAEQIMRDRAQSSTPLRIVVYSYFLERGVEGFQHFLHTYYPVLACALWEDKADTLQWFHSNASDTRILLLSSRSGKGISLNSVAFFHLMEPQWSAAEEEQAIGRATRTGSHSKAGAVVTVYRWQCHSPTDVKSTDQRMETTRELKRLSTLALLRKWQRVGMTRLDNLLRTSL